MDLFGNDELYIEDNLLKKFEEIHNFFYANDGLSTQQALDEFVKLLFIKIYDENKQLNLFFIDNQELNHAKKLNESIKFYERIAELFDKTKIEFIDTFSDDEKIKLSINSLAFAVNKLQNISLSGSSKDSKGLAFQKYLASQEKISRGQFFTPEAVIDFCVKFINPNSNEKIIDPACGSGGFLFSCLKHLRNENLNIEDYIKNNLFGIDINSGIAKIAKMKFLLESNTQVNIFCTNSLEDIDEMSLLFKDLQFQRLKNSFDIVLTNPPFGTIGKITNDKILSKFELGFKWIEKNNIFYRSNNILKGQVAEILFIERCIDLLKDGGRMGIVLPNGHFENSSLDYLRYYIKNKAEILGIINLPPETFIPYGTGVKTSLLFLRKNTNLNKKDYKIFFGKITKIGYQGSKNGSPIYKKDKYGSSLKDINGNNIIDEDFSKVLNDYNFFNNGTLNLSNNSFIINYSQLNCRFDYDYYSPDNTNLLSSLKNAKSIKLKEIADIVKSKSKLLSETDKEIEYIELSDINTYSFEIINFNKYLVHELPSRASYELKSGDIITAVAGNSIGTKKHATAIVTDEFEGSICTNGFRILRNFKIDKYYLLYYLKSDFFLKQIMMFRTGAAIPCISDSDFDNILVLIPDENIIKEISNKVQKSLMLRHQSKKEIETIELVLK